MDVDPNVLRHAIWHIPQGEKPVHEPIVVREWLEYTVQHVISIMRDEDLLEVRHAVVEWNGGTPVVTMNVRSSLPMGTVAYIADEWREEVGG